MPRKGSLLWIEAEEGSAAVGPTNPALDLAIEEGAPPCIQAEEGARTVMDPTDPVAMDPAAMDPAVWRAFTTFSPLGEARRRATLAVGERERWGDEREGEAASEREGRRGRECTDGESGWQ